MASKVKGAIEQLRAARSGERRTDQYVVQEQGKIVEEVTEEEYNKIRNERLDDFIVGDTTLGFEDDGREMWEGQEAKREKQREALEHKRIQQQKQQLQAESKQQQKGTSANQSSQPNPKESIFGALRAGAATKSVTTADPKSIPSKDVRQNKELDSMLQSMMDSIGETLDDDVVEVAAKPSVIKAKGPAKRKIEGNGGVPASKKLAALSGTSQTEESLKAIVKTEGSETTAAPKIKREPDVEMTAAPITKMSPLAAAFAGTPSLSAEMAGGAQPPISTSRKEVKKESAASPIKSEAVKPCVKTEPLEGGSPSSTTSSTQLKDWLQGGACTGVQVDSPAKTSSMTPVRAAEVQPGIEADGALWFFLVDAFEEDRASPPRLYLFGKVKSQVSKF